MSTPQRILLTGPPGCGKTTAILRTVPLLGAGAAGFYTEEVRSGARGRGARAGFDVVTLEGRRGALARAGAAGPRVGRYGVDVASFEAVGVRALAAGLGRGGTVLVVDELGKMEFLSSAFVDLLDEVFASAHPVLGTILSKPHPVADRIRARADVRIVEVTPGNRDGLPGQLADSLSSS